MHVLQDSVAERSGEHLSFSNGRVLDSVVVKRVGPIWRVRDESGPMLGLKLLVGLRWRNFIALRRRRVMEEKIWLVGTRQVIR